ncbi:UNVERIFIED_CONTAM: hypothetical protein RMT77_018161 [Armadillidium vulgare]
MHFKNALMEPERKVKKSGRQQRRKSNEEIDEDYEIKRENFEKYESIEEVSVIEELVNLYVPEAKEVMVENEVETDEDESDMKLNEMKSTLDDDGAETEREQGNEIVNVQLEGRECTEEEMLRNIAYKIYKSCKQGITKNNSSKLSIEGNK